MVAPSPLGDFAYKNIENFVIKTKEVKEERDQQFKTQGKVKKIAYYVFMSLSVAALIAMPMFVAAAAINVSLGYLGYAAIATAAMFAFTWLSGCYNSMTHDEIQIFDKFKNPLGLDNNRDSVPEASALKRQRAYFESLVAEKQSDKEKEIQMKKLQIVEKLFDKKFDKDKNIEKNEIKQNIATLATTSLLLETIQHVFKIEQKQAQENIKKIKDGKLLDSSSFIYKPRISKMIDVLEKPTKEFLINLRGKIETKQDRAIFKMSDLDKVLDLAEQPKLQVAK